MRRDSLTHLNLLDVLLQFYQQRMRCIEMSDLGSLGIHDHEVKVSGGYLWSCLYSRHLQLWAGVSSVELN